MLTVPFHFDSDHPAFPGHFPGRPIVPGVQLLDQAKRIIESKHSLIMAGIQVAKFLSPAKPDDMMELNYEIAENHVVFEIRCDTRLIASGKFLVAKRA